MKQTYSAWVNTENGNRKWHLSKRLFPSLHFLRFPSLTAAKRRITPNERRTASEPSTTCPRSATSWFLRATFSATRTSDPISPSTRSRTTPRGHIAPCISPQGPLIRPLPRIHTTRSNRPHTFRSRTYLQTNFWEEADGHFFRLQSRPGVSLRSRGRFRDPSPLSRGHERQRLPSIPRRHVLATQLRPEAYRRFK